MTGEIGWLAEEQRLRGSRRTQRSSQCRPEFLPPVPAAEGEYLMWRSRRRRLHELPTSLESNGGPK